MLYILLHYKITYLEQSVDLLNTKDMDSNTGSLKQTCSSFQLVFKIAHIFYFNNCSFQTVMYQLSKLCELWIEKAVVIWIDFKRGLYVESFTSEKQSPPPEGLTRVRWEKQLAKLLLAWEWETSFSRSEQCVDKCGSVTDQSGAAQMLVLSWRNPPWQLAVKLITTAPQQSTLVGSVSTSKESIG